MKQRTIIIILIAVFASANSFAQLTIEPGIGIHTNFGKDFLVTNLVQWNPHKRLSLASHSSFNINNMMKRNSNGIKTNYDYSINQKFGVGTTVYSKRSSSTFLLMAGIKYTSFKETLVDADNHQITAAVNALSPDYGLMYSMKRGLKKYFFSFRMYIPLYPWPVKDVNISAADGNMGNIALEFGLGIKIK